MKFQSKCLVLLAAVQSVTATSYSPSSIITSSSPSLSYKSKQSILGNIRGGAVDIIDEETPQKKNKATKSSKTKGGTATQKTQQQPQTETNDDDEAKVAINTAMKESDTAHTLGEAIRARAHILRQDKLPYQERTFDSALVSLGLSLGTAGLDVDLDEEEDIIGVVSNEDEEEEGTDKEEEVQHTKKSTMMAYYQYGHRIPRYHPQQQNQQFVQPSTSAVIANYFLKTHGGTHLLQCVLSLLASVLGMICLMLPSFPSSSITTPPSTTNKKVISSITLSKQILQSTLKYQLLQQTLLLAMTKHISAIVGAVILGAQSIPTLGIRNARYHLEMVALDPVGQYLFYCSILVVWLGWFGGGGSGGSSEFVLRLRRSVISIQNAAAAASAAAATTGTDQEVETISQLLDVLSQSSPPWFLSQSHGMGTIVPIIMLTPILLREVISIIWVVSDVLSLALTSSSSGGGIMGKFCQGILSTARSILDTFMSLVISSDDQWKKADSFQRQRTLARLVSQTSLILELIVGVVLFGDAIQAFWGFSFGGGSGAVLGAPRLPLKIVVGKMVCAHLYINFLLSRRRKIHALVGSIRSSRERKIIN